MTTYNEVCPTMYTPNFFLLILRQDYTLTNKRTFVFGIVLSYYRSTSITLSKYLNESSINEYNKCCKLLKLLYACDCLLFTKNYMLRYVKF